MTKNSGIVLVNMLLMLSYSSVFIWRGETGLGGWPQQAEILHQWGVLLVHIAVLVIVSRCMGKPPELRRTYLLAAALVGLVGHGLCVYNGAANAAWN